MPAEQFHPLPQPEEIPTREREDAMGAYLMMFAAWGAGLPLPLINILAAVIYFYVNRKRGRFVVFHAAQSLWSQIMVGLINAGVVFWVVRLVIYEFQPSRAFFSYLIFAVVANLVYIIFSIIAAVKARRGQMYYFWFFGKLAYRQAYLIREHDPSEPPRNVPPNGI